MVCCRAQDATGEFAVEERKGREVHLTFLDQCATEFPGRQCFSYGWLTQRSQNGLEGGTERVKRQEES